MRTYYLVIFVLVSNILFAQTVFNKNYTDTVGIGNWISTSSLVVTDSTYYINGGFADVLGSCDTILSRGACFLKIDSSGILAKVKYLANCDKYIWEGNYESLLLKDNEMFSCGSFSYHENTSSCYLIRLNLNLSILDVNEFVLDTTTKRAVSLCQTHDNNLLVCGATDSTYNEMLGFPDTTFTKSCLFKIAVEGDIIWQKSYSFGDESDGCYSILRYVIPTYDKGFIATGRTSDFGNSKNLVLKVDSLGNQE
jgi:hypothetical protein